MRNKTLLLLAMSLQLLGITSLAAAPTRDEILGTYIVMNYQTYDDGTTYLKDVRACTLTADPDAENGVIVSNFYIRQGKAFKATYSEVSGNLTIAAGTPLFLYTDGSGSGQWLYAWNEDEGAVISRPVTYRLRDGGGWECTQTLVLVMGDDAETGTPYTFAQGSLLCKANATTSNLSYIYDLNYTTGALSVAATYDESRASLVALDGHVLSIYNLHTVDSYGYGCHIDLAYVAETGQVASPPTVIGEMSTSYEYPYKALAGTDFDTATKTPRGAYQAGTAAEGRITGTCDMTAGEIRLNPTSIYPVSYDTTTGELAVYYGSVYETIEHFTVQFDPAALAADVLPSRIDAPSLQSEPVSERYYSLTGQQLPHPAHGTLVVRQQTFADGTTRTAKVFIR